MVKYRERKHDLYFGPEFGSKYDNNVTSPVRDIELDEWEYRILIALKSSSKTEKRLCKEIKLNTSIVSELITSLMEKGLISGARKKKLFLYSAEYFSTTLDALKILQIEARHQKKNGDGLIDYILAFASYWLR
jgi:DNA-binding MarR family transcriptional regulator